MQSTKNMAKNYIAEDMEFTLNVLNYWMQVNGNHGRKLHTNYEKEGWKLKFKQEKGETEVAFQSHQWRPVNHLLFLKSGGVS